jgi:hypothetical protein
MAKPLEEWTPVELQTEISRLADELARRADAPPPAKAGKGRVDVARACENWVLGLAWDETFTREMVDDELAILERKAGHELGPLERERLLQLWLDEYDRRYKAA